jgi:hypothetical protein
MDNDTDLSDRKMLEDIKKDLRTYHPAIQLIANENDDESVSEITLVSPDRSYKNFALSPSGICSCPECEKEFAPLLELHKMEENHVESISDSDGEGNKVKASGKDPGALGAIANPIIVESDNEDSSKTNRLRVFTFTSRSEVQDALNRLREAAGLSNGSETSGLMGSLRRSTRKRKTVFPVGCICKESEVKVGLQHNVAALRLFLFESCEIKLQWNLYAALVTSDNDQLPIVLKLGPSCNEATIDDVLVKLRKETGISSARDTDVDKELYLLCQETEQDSDVIEASLMDTMIDKSNAAGMQEKDGKKKRNRPSERGFRGTLLQSSSSLAGTNDNDSSKSQEDDLPSKHEEKKEPKPVPQASVSDEDSAVDSAPVAQPISGNTSDSSDGGLILSPGVSSESPKAKRARRLESAAGRRDGICDTIVAGNLDEVFDPISLKAAVEWAMAENPGANDKTIRDLAVVKYLHNQEALNITFGSASDEVMEVPAPSSRSPPVKAKVLIPPAKMERMMKRLSDSVRGALTPTNRQLRVAVKAAVENNPGDEEMTQLDAAMAKLFEVVDK